jgi:hypothetical protein
MKFKSAAQRKKVMSILGRRLQKLGLSTKTKLPETWVRSGRQIGTTKAKYDHMHKALAPGKRISKRAKVYYEYRKNHSDKTPGKYKTTV